MEIKFGNGLVRLLMLALFATTLAAQPSTAPAQTQSKDDAPTLASSSTTASQQVIGHGAFPVKVIKALDSSKLKPGDIVEFKTAGAFILPNGTKVPEGANVTGHVTEAKARSKGDSQSQLAIVFDRISLAHDEQLTIKGTVQAVGPNPSDDTAPVPNGPTMQAHGNAAPGWTPTTDIKSGSNMESPASSSQMVTPQSTGVHGIRGLQLGEDGVLTSNGKQVKLDNGVRIIVRGEILG